MQSNSNGSNEVRAVVTDVQRFSVHDGPGIRTLVFFKGSPLRCRWCHNPETQRAAPEIRFRPARCIGCGACTRSCAKGAHAFVHAEFAEAAEFPSHHRYDRSVCVGCGMCAAACPSGALERVGEERSVKELVGIALRDAPFYGRDGGLTLSHAHSVEILPYHALGAGNDESLGRAQHVYETPAPAALAAFASVLRDAGVPLCGGA